MFVVSFSETNTSLPIDLHRNAHKVRLYPWCDRVHTMKETEKGYGSVMPAETPWKSTAWQALLRCSQRTEGLIMLPHATSWQSVTNSLLQLG